MGFTYAELSLFGRLRKGVGFGPNPVMLSRGSMVASMPLCH